MKYTSESITNLITDLQGEDESARSLAAFALVLLGDPAVEPLAYLLDHDSSEVRMRAAWALGVIGGPAVPMMIKLIESENRRLRTEAIRVLGVIGEARTLNHLMAALTDLNIEVASRAARAIGKIGDTRAYHALLMALHHPAPDVRYEACRALADLRLSEAAPYLREVAENDTQQTSWGVPVAEMAQRAADDISHNTGKITMDAEFARISKLLQQHAQKQQEQADQEESG
jgi:HEAT repeat protein